MIDTDKTIKCIEEYINGSAEKPFIEVKQDDTALEQYMKRTALRLIYTYEKYGLKSAGKSDYLCSLRNFMLVFKTYLEIKDATLLINNHFGIKSLDNSSNYYATEDLPTFIHNKSILEGFVTKTTELPAVETRYSLQTNPYIYNLTGFSHFKTIEQKLCVYGALNQPEGYTSLISMPTGGGKSLVTQTVAYREKGLTIVVIPTVSLAIDQQKEAVKTIKHDTSNEIFCYYSRIKNKDKIIESIRNKEAKLLFISPEALLMNNDFKEIISAANKDRYLKNLIIDEAHTVIAWGDYFRVDYKCLEPWRRQLMQSNPDLKTFLLSATFTDDTVKYLKSMFSSDGKWIELRCDSLRKEPRFSVIKCNDIQKNDYFIRLVNKLPHPMIVYVNSPEDAEKYKLLLNRYGYLNINTFTGETNSNERDRLIDLWRDDQFDLMIATSAFGVGVSKPDVRTVLHLYIPESPDAYYQELGRGGRDGLPCLSVMCINPKADVELGFNHITTVLKPETIYDRWWTMLSDYHNIHSGNTMAIDTSVKPDHTKKGIFEEGNKKDSLWNINVLLLLRRYNAIAINEVSQIASTDRYQITIEVLKPELLMDEVTTINYLSDIRAAEAKRSTSKYKRLVDAINNAGISCWSDMFYDTYPLVSEYCGGCDKCQSIVADKKHVFPLLKTVSGPEKKTDNKIKELYGINKETLIISRNFESTEINKLINYLKPDVIVTENIIPKELYFKLSSITYNIMNFREFSNLISNNDFYYLSSLILVLYDDPTNLSEEFRLTKKYLARANGYVMHVSRQDYKLIKVEKKMSDMINGPVFTIESIIGGNN